jgi:hypothetical protein
MQAPSTHLASLHNVNSHVLVDYSAPGRLPGFVSTLVLQNPALPKFSKEDLQWQHIPGTPHSALVAAFPRSQLECFRRGEEERQNCQLLLSSHRKPTDGVLAALEGTCCFAGPQHSEQKERQQLAPSSDPQIVTAGRRARKGAHQSGTSCKKGCSYHFFAKVYAKCADTVIVKFPCSGNDTVHTCPSMQHILPTGQVGHEDEDHHKLKYTEEIEQFVLPRLRAQMKASVIMSGANHGTDNIAPWRP